MTTYLLNQFEIAVTRILMAISLAMCAGFGNAYANPAAEMVPPSSVTLFGLQRHVSLATEIGRIELRWTRESEKLFGQTPERATIEAAAALAKALRQSSFPNDLKYMRPNWQVVFLSRDTKASEVPSELSTSCHPGWMTRPANIYIAAEQVAGGCGGARPNAGKINDVRLSNVLLHEMGHAVEYALAPEAPFERARSEGFATWIEIFAGKHSRNAEHSTLLNDQKSLARLRLRNPDPTFRGGADDYALAGMLFHTFLKDRTENELARLYELISKDQLSFVEAIGKVSGWSEKRLNEKLEAFIR